MAVEDKKFFIRENCTKIFSVHPRFLKTKVIKLKLEILITNTKSISWKHKQLILRIFAIKSCKVQVFLSWQNFNFKEKMSIEECRYHRIMYWEHQEKYLNKTVHPF